jgi:predicted  nucleic acid-binding Zn-ribbon protein
MDATPLAEPALGGQMVIDTPHPKTPPTFLRQYLSTSTRPQIAIAGVRIYDPGRTRAEELLAEAEKAVRLYGPAGAPGAAWFDVNWSQIAADKSIHGLLFAHWFSLVQLVMVQLSAVDMGMGSSKPRASQLSGIRFLKSVVLPLYNMLASQGSVMLDAPGASDALAKYFSFADSGGLLISSGMVANADADRNIARYKSLFFGLQSAVNSQLDAAAISLAADGVQISEVQSISSPGQIPDTSGRLLKFTQGVQSFVTQISTIVEVAESAGLSGTQESAANYALANAVLRSLKAREDRIAMLTPSTDVSMVDLGQTVAEKDAEIASMRNTINRLESELKAATERSDARLQMVTATAKQDAAKAIENEQKSCEEAKERLNRELKAARDTLKETTEKCDATVANLTKKTEALEKERDDAKTEAKRATDAAKAAESDAIKQLQKQVDSITKQLNSANSALTTATQRQGETAEALRKSNKELKTAKDELKATTKELKAAKDELKTANDELLKVRQASSALVSTKASSEERYNALVRENALLRDRVIASNTKALEFQTQFSTIQSESANQLQTLRSQLALQYQKGIEDASANAKTAIATAEQLSKYNMDEAEKANRLVDLMTTAALERIADAMFTPVEVLYSVVNK